MLCKYNYSDEMVDGGGCVMCIGWGKEGVKVGGRGGGGGGGVNGYSGRGFYGSINFLACLLEL